MVKKVIAKFRKPQTVVLSNSDKVKVLSEKAVGLFDHMKKAHDELSVINVELNQVISDEEAKLLQEEEAHERKKANRCRTIEIAHEELGMNYKLQGKLGEFIR